MVLQCMLQCINGVSSNPVEGRTKIWQLKNLILTLFGLIFIIKKLLEISSCHVNFNKFILASLRKWGIQPSEEQMAPCVIAITYMFEVWSSKFIIFLITGTVLQITFIEEMSTRQWKWENWKVRWVVWNFFSNEFKCI